MKKKFYVMRGLPGSGKSTLVRTLTEALAADGYVWIEHSTDEYWIRPDGYYDWNPKRVAEAHAWNYKSFCRSIDAGVQCVILDNTNTMLREFVNYVGYAIKNGYEINIVEPTTAWKFDVEECAKRNTHRVPQESIQRMKDRWETTPNIIESLTHQYEVPFNQGLKL
jgi:tRNA uridine 5-carbamoylmethylation protein Kti12